MELSFPVKVAVFGVSSCVVILHAFFLELRRARREYEPTTKEPNQDAILKRSAVARAFIVSGTHLIIWPFVYFGLTGEQLTFQALWCLSLSVIPVLFGSFFFSPHGYGSDEEPEKQASYRRFGAYDNAWLGGAGMFLGTVQLAVTFIAISGVVLFHSVSNSDNQKPIPEWLSLLQLAIAVTIATGFLLRVMEPMTGWLNRAAGEKPAYESQTSPVHRPEPKESDFATMESIRIEIREAARKKRAEEEGES